MAEIFRRVEKKYMINEEQHQKMLEEMMRYMREDRYGKSTICNIYFDSDNYDLINRSIEKPIFKEKVRLRSYNVPNEESDVYLEIKRKYDGVVGKRRIGMKLSDFHEYCKNRESIASNNPQIKSELDYCFQMYHLKPTMYISYLREAYYGLDDAEFRVTFDTHILARQEDLELANGSYGEEILGEGQYIMEVKTLASLPLWFVNLLNELHIVPGSFSKYGTAYQEMVMHPIVAIKEYEREYKRTQNTEENQILRRTALAV